MNYKAAPHFNKPEHNHTHAGGDKKSYTPHTGNARTSKNTSKKDLAKITEKNRARDARITQQARLAKELKDKEKKAAPQMKYSAATQMGHSPAEMSPLDGHCGPMKMESAKQEKYNLMHDNPVVKHASGGSWMSKHSKSALRMGHSPAEMGHDSPAKKEGEKPKNTEQLAAESRARGKKAAMKANAKKDKKEGRHTGTMVKVRTSTGKIIEVDSRSQAARDLPRA